MRLEPAPRRAAPLFLGRLPRAAVVVALLGALGLCGGGTGNAAELFVIGPAGAALSVDGHPAGALPLPGPLTLEPGTYLIRCELPGHEPFETEARLDAPRARQIVRASLAPLSRRSAVAYGLVFAGLGQQYLGRPRLGWTLTALETGGLLAGLAGEMSLRNRRDDYLVLYDAYQSALTQSDIVAKKAAADEAWRKVEHAAALRDTGLLVAAGAVVAGVLDAWLRFPSVEAGVGTLTRATNAAAAPGDGAPALDCTAAPALHVAWTVRF